MNAKIWGPLAFLISGAAIAATRLLESVWIEGGLVLAGLFDAAHFLAAGLCIALISWIGDLMKVGRPWLGWIAVGAIATALGSIYLDDDVDGFSRRQELLPQQVAYFGTTLAVSLSVVVAAWLGRALDRNGWRWFALLGGMGLSWANGLVLEHDYRGIHLFIAGFALMLSGTAFRKAEGRPRWLSEGAALAAVALIIAPALVFSPPAHVGVVLANSTGAAFSPIFTRVRRISTPTLGADSEWWNGRDSAPDVAPSPQRPVAAQPVVILITIDALRADVVLSRKHDALLPTLARIRDEGLSFTQARAPGTLTKTSLASVFIGTYFSQQFWSPMENRGGALTVHADESVRFPELLKQSGVKTDNYRSVNWLRNGVVMRGFQHDEYVEYPKKKSYYTPSPPVFKQLLPRLKKHLKSGKPAFVYTHLSDPHAPYDQGKVKKGKPFERYLSEVELVDSQLGKLLEVVGKSDRKDSILLIISADHGEAFGEHNAKTHGTTMYDEALHVPLLFFQPGASWQRHIDDPVSLIDLGPTILDVFNCPTPGHMMGQSLVPYLNGESPQLTRPIFAETRLMRAYISDKLMKLIVDARTGRHELYDLNQDPRELVNLSDDEQLVAPLLGTMERFFKEHTLRRKGYKPPLVK